MTKPSDIRLLGGVLNHLNTAHPDAAVVFVAGGLPSLPQRLVGPDRDHPYITNPERLFVFKRHPAAPDVATAALIRPAQRRVAGWDADAVDTVLEACGGYPAHLQVFAAAAWIQGTGTNFVTRADVTTTLAEAKLLIEQQYLSPRWQRLGGVQQAYLTAVTLCGVLVTVLSPAAMRKRVGGTGGLCDFVRRRGAVFHSGLMSVKSGPAPADQLGRRPQRCGPSPLRRSQRRASRRSPSDQRAGGRTAYRIGARRQCQR